MQMVEFHKGVVSAVLMLTEHIQTISNTIISEATHGPTKGKEELPFVPPPPLLTRPAKCSNKNKPPMET